MKKTEITKILNNSRIKIQKAKELLGPLAEQDSPSLNDDLSQLSGTIMIEDIDPN